MMNVELIVQTIILDVRYILVRCRKPCWIRGCRDGNKLTYRMGVAILHENIHIEDMHRLLRT
jgi:hypothetical protein